MSYSEYERHRELMNVLKEIRDAVRNIANPPKKISADLEALREYTTTEIVEELSDFADKNMLLMRVSEEGFIDDILDFSFHKPGFDACYRTMTCKGVTRSFLDELEKGIKEYFKID